MQNNMKVLLLVTLFCAVKLAYCVPPVTVLQQEGDDCGDCLAPPSFHCGTCAAGLECQKNEFLPDAPGTCISTVLQQEGDDCGDCLAPPSFHCGTCAAGLECQKNEFLPDAPGTCIKQAVDCYDNCIGSGKGGRECSERCKGDNLKLSVKQEGEECGSCFSPSSNFFCGSCAAGLQCSEVPTTGPPLGDAPKRCMKETVNKVTKEYGEECGRCFSPDTNFFCGECAPGLDCNEGLHEVPYVGPQGWTTPPRECQLPTKQEGDECGSCFSPDTGGFCGACASGLECVKDRTNVLLPDAAARCRKKPGTKQFDEECGRCFSLENNFSCGDCVSGLECKEVPTTGPPLGDAPKKCQLPTKQEGEECGSCFSPDTNFTCGTCASGLDCVKDPANKLLPDAPARCKKAVILLIPIESDACNPEHQRCGVNAICKVVAERARCLCPEGYTGDPFDRCVREELKIPCRNPGKNVPSPHDVCNTCICSEDGILGGCTKTLCIPEVVEANPFEKLLYCATNDANYCEEKTDGEFNSCHNLPQPSCFIDNKTVKNCYGVCVPEDVPCNSRHPCKPIGNTSSGQLTSRCLNNKCVYAPALVIA